MSDRYSNTVIVVLLADVEDVIDSIGPTEDPSVLRLRDAVEAAK